MTSFVVACFVSNQSDFHSYSPTILTDLRYYLTNFIKTGKTVCEIVCYGQKSFWSYDFM